MPCSPHRAGCRPRQSCGSVWTRWPRAAVRRSKSFGRFWRRSPRRPKGMAASRRTCRPSWTTSSTHGWRAGPLDRKPWRERSGLRAFNESRCRPLIPQAGGRHDAGLDRRSKSAWRETAPLRLAPLRTALPRLALFKSGLSSRFWPPCILGVYALFGQGERSSSAMGASPWLKVPFS